MKKSIEIQQKNFNKLTELMKENPNLKVIPMVDSEVVDEDYRYWAGSFGEPRIDCVYIGDERIYFKDDDFEELVDEQSDNMADEEQFKELSDEAFFKRAEEYVENLEWEKVITLNIGLPR